MRIPEGADSNLRLPGCAYSCPVRYFTFCRFSYSSFDMVVACTR